MINRKNTYKSKSNNETDDKKAKPALQHCSRNKGVRTPGPAVLTALRKPAAFALLICIGATAILGCSGGESHTGFVRRLYSSCTDAFAAAHRRTESVRDRITI